MLFFDLYFPENLFLSDLFLILVRFSFILIMGTDLTLVEKFVLLARHPEKARFVTAGTQLWYGIAGALLMEMSLQERIEIRDGRVNLKNDKKITDPMLSEIAGMMGKAAKSRKIRYWINRIYRNANKYKKEIITDLVKKGVLRQERKNFLGLIPYTSNYIRDRRTREKLIRHFKMAVLHPSSTEVTGADLALLGLIEASKMHKTLSSDKDELKRIKKELKQVIEKSPIAGIVDKTIKEVQAAIMVTTVIVGAGGR